MIDETILASLGSADDDAQRLVAQALGESPGGTDRSSYLDPILRRHLPDLEPGRLIKGRVVGFAGNDVVVDVGFKSEGLIPRDEFEGAEVHVGDVVEVLLEDLEGDGGSVVLSKRKADRMLNWQRIMDTTREGDVVEGVVVRKIKGGLLVDIGVHAFLPASQVDIRRPGDVGEYIGKRVRAQIIKIDQERRNIVISRRKLIEEEREAARRRLLETLREGDIVTGEVKNIADFGAFVDLGGIDGLLHVTDMAWGRVSHPGEILKVGQKINVKVLHIDREKEKIALGLKQCETSPWDQIEKKYPVGARVRGTVVNLMSYGAFVRLEDGIEGLVHVSEMSWTRRINHPSEVVQPGQEVDVVVLAIDKDKQEISLGLKQAEGNPWELVSQKYPPGTVIEGRVRGLASYGAFIEIEPGIEGLLRVGDMSWTRKITLPGEVLKEGQTVRCMVLEVDQARQRVSLGLKQMTEDPWLNAIPEHYRPGMVVRGKVTKITNFGVFVELEPELEGLLHISELADHKVENPQDVVKIGDEVDVKILRVDTQERKIGLSLKRAQWGGVAGGEGERHARVVSRGGVDPHDAMGTDKIRMPER